MTSLLVKNQRIKKYLPPFVKGKGGGVFPLYNVGFQRHREQFRGKFLLKEIPGQLPQF